MMHRVVAARVTPEAVGEQITLRGVPSSVPEARRFVADRLAGCPRADDLLIAVSELATNALDWSASGCGGTFTVRVCRAPRWTRVEVTDEGPAPVPAASGNGYGLRLVGTLTDRSGSGAAEDGHRTAWVEVMW